jgi:hypothetical protein
VHDSEFSYTGKARFSSSPAAGIDLEHPLIWKGRFKNCKFENNVGAQVTFASPARDIEFTDCKIAGKTALYQDGGQEVVFRGTDKPKCSISGIIRILTGPRQEGVDQITCDGVTTYFKNCTLKSGGTTGSFIIADGHCLNMEDCQVNATTSKALWVAPKCIKNLGGGTKCIHTTVIKNSTILHAFPKVTNYGYQSVVRGALLQNVTFTEKGLPLDRYWYIEISGSFQNSCQNVRVTGPQVRWAHPKNPSAIGLFQDTEDGNCRKITE